MHKGRFYRRVLPPGISQNMNDRGFTPWQMFFTFSVFWNNLQVGVVRKISGPPTVDLSRLLVVWRFPFSVGPENYNFFFDQSPIAGSPNMKFEMLVEDNYGGFFACDWRGVFPDLHYQSDINGWRPPNNIAAGGFFSAQLGGLSTSPVSYHEE